jgi:hypothetical protein
MSGDEVRVTVAEAARFFGVALNTVWSWINREPKLEPVGIRRRVGSGQSPYEFRFGDLAQREREARHGSKSGRPRKARL